MINEILLSPPIVFLIFLVLFSLSYRVISIYSSKGEHHPDKYLPYSSGQSLPPAEIFFSYQSFFRLGLLFAVLHLTVLVISTIPLNQKFNLIGLIYLIGIFLSAFALAKDHSK